MSNCQPPEIVGLGSETQFQVGEKIICITLKINPCAAGPVYTVIIYGFEHA